jgi:hypothetical protein
MNCFISFSTGNWFNFKKHFMPLPNNSDKKVQTPVVVPGLTTTNENDLTNESFKYVTNSLKLLENLEIYKV